MWACNKRSDRAFAVMLNSSKCVWHSPPAYTRHSLVQIGCSRCRSRQQSLNILPLLDTTLHKKTTTNKQAKTLSAFWECVWSKSHIWSSPPHFCPALKMLMNTGWNWRFLSNLTSTMNSSAGHQQTETKFLKCDPRKGVIGLLSIKTHHFLPSAGREGRPGTEPWPEDETNSAAP